MIPVCPRTAWGFVLLLAACGYQPVHTLADSPNSRWCVRAGPELAEHPQAGAALVFGARNALSRAGRRAACPDAPALFVQVVGVAFESEGVVARDVLTARGTRIRLTAAGHASDGSDVGTVVEHVVVATGATPMDEQNAHAAGVVAASRRAGEALVRRLLARPGPSATAERQP